jgi:RNA polymerase sigma factor (sigma-70 family)
MQIITRELIHKCKKNNQAAMAELFSKLAPKLKGICYRYCGNAFDAEDLLQETFITIFTKISSYQEQGSFEGWAHRIAVNTSLNWLRKNKVFFQMLELNNQHDQEDNHENDPVSDIHIEGLIQHIAQLPDGYRTILNLFAIEGYSHKEIAEQLGINESTSRSQYTRAKKVLQQRFMKEKDHEKF